jgi:hypothetical protein
MAIAITYFVNRTTTYDEDNLSTGWMPEALTSPNKLNYTNELVDALLKNKKIIIMRIKNKIY